jgi:hypothetical protein
MFSSVFFNMFFGAYAIGVPVATALMETALWRSRIASRWLAVLYFGGLEIAFQVPSVGIVGVLLMLPFAVAMVLLARRIWCAAALQPGNDSSQPVTLPV